MSANRLTRNYVTPYHIDPDFVHPSTLPPPKRLSPSEIESKIFIYRERREHSRKAYRLNAGHHREEYFRACILRYDSYISHYKGELV